MPVIVIKVVQVHKAGAPLYGIARKVTGKVVARLRVAVEYLKRGGGSIIINLIN